MEYNRQKRFINNIIFIGLIGLLVYVTLEYAIKLVSPFIFAFIFAYILRRPAVFISRTMRVHYKVVAIFLVLLFYCTIGLILSLLGVKLLSFIANFASGLPPLYKNQIVPTLSEFFSDIEQTVSRMDPSLIPILNDLFSQAIVSIGELVSDISVKLVALISSYASSLPIIFIKLIIMIISTFFIAADYELLTEFVARQFTGKSLTLLREIKNYVVGTLFVCIRAYALIMSITFIELSIGFKIIGVGRPVLTAFLIAIFDILPVLGTGGIIVPWAIISALQSNYSFAIGLFVIYGVVTIVRNVIEPKIVGSQIGLHPVVTLLSIFVGAQLFGVIGLFGLPITLSLLRHLNETGAISIFK